MTEPTPPKPNRLSDVRGLLHAALVQTMADCGWPAERARSLPPRQVVEPMGWVDAPTLAQGTTGGARAITATFPVAVAVDGADSAQVEQLDSLLAYGVTHLEAVKLPSGTQARVLTAGPQFLDVGGAETRAVVFSVQVALQIRTLCSGSATGSDEAPPAP